MTDHPTAETIPSTHRLVVVAHDEDIDELDHVSNVVYVRWIQQVAEAHSASRGWDVDDYRSLGAVFVVRRHDIEYLRPARAGDRLELTTWVESWRAASSIRRTRITRLGDGHELVRATTTWAFVALDSGRPRRIPDEVKMAFQQTGRPPPTDDTGR